MNRCLVVGCACSAELAGLRHRHSDQQEPDRQRDQQQRPHRAHVVTGLLDRSSDRLERGINLTGTTFHRPHGNGEAA